MTSQKELHILIVDDHASIREPLAEYFAQNGVRASMAANGKAMWKVLKRDEIDLIVLDVLMPGENGVDLCRDLRRTTDIPIVFLTAVLEETDRIVGLELGADDYVTKPFNPRELLARIRTIVRRTNSIPRQFADMRPGMIRFGDWVLDSGRQRLTSQSAQSPIDLSVVEFKLLIAFLSSPGIVLSREVLLDRVNGHGRAADVFDRSIDNQVSRLRKKIDPDVKDPKIIKTVWGGGYMLICDVVKL